MSYCRWSSDDFACDVYVYEDCRGGWTTHVAANRLVPSEPMPAEIDPRDPEWIEHWLARHQEVARIVDASEREEIGLPYDGGTFNDSTPGWAADTLEMLRKAGYNVPEYAITELREEEAEAQT